MMRSVVVQEGGANLKLWAIVLTLILSAGIGVNFINPFLLLILLLMVLSIPLALISLDHGILVFIALAAFSDLGKRLLFVATDEVSNVIYYGVIFLPDLIFLFILGLSIEKYFKLGTQRNRLVTLVLLFFFWNVLSLLNPASGLFTKIAGFKLFSIYILGFFIGYVHASGLNKRKVMRFVSVMFSIGFVASLYGIYQFIQGYTGFENAWLQSGKPSIGLRMLTFHDVYRAFSIFSGVQSFALFMALCLLLCLFVFVYWKRDGICILPLAAIFGLGLVVSISRGTWLGLAVALGIMALLTASRMHLKTVVILFLLGLVLVFGLSRNQLQSLTRLGLKSDIPLVSRSLDVRTLYGRTDNIWGQLLTQISARKTTLIFGKGMGSKSAAAKLESDEPELLHYGADNMYIETLFQLGVIGLSLFLILLWSALSSMTNVVRREGPKWLKTYTLVLAGYIITVLLTGIVSSSLDLRPLNFLFWFFLGIFAFYAKNKIPEGLDTAK